MRGTTCTFSSVEHISPFLADRLKALYADHNAYVAAVAASTEDLVRHRYILEEDAAAYIEAAKAAPIP